MVYFEFLKNQNRIFHAIWLLGLSGDNFFEFTLNVVISTDA